ncbi:MAG: 16S rRNA (cytosine(967)-C(5))-methyltransferase [Xenococcaceae cyanobacterium MO_188.B29]|nr:16S rRNA (cytosine(967)-C(5))-methyltransferase [Xenococcaceae cyanobacterium MO_188.B29]
MIYLTNPRQLAFLALQDVYQKKAYTDIALDRFLRQAKLNKADKGLACELLYGIVRRQRTLDALIDALGKKKAHQQPPKLRIILHIGLYQLRYLSQIPDSAAVNTSVELGKKNGLSKLTGVINGILREYLRISLNKDPLVLPVNPVQRLGILHSFPDWIIQTWLEQLEKPEVDRLCNWFNQTPSIDLRVNILKTSVEEVETALSKAGVSVSRLPYLPQALRLTGGAGAIQKLPGYQEGWWIVQDSSAQLVTHLLDPQPGEIVIDACAAPGGKTTHIAELMQDSGTIIACDRDGKRLKKVQANAQRLGLRSIQTCVGDSLQLEQFREKGDRVLLDAPCSGLGTLHKRPDIRWRQTPDKIEELSRLQTDLLKQVATWVKPQGILVYATCTLNLLENEKVIKSFLSTHPHWSIEIPPSFNGLHFVTAEGWLKIFPQRHNMDGFFLVRLKKQE